MKYKINLNNKIYEVVVEDGQAMLIDEYELKAPKAPAPKAAPAPAAPAAPVPAAPASDEMFSSGSLKLKNCDEKTAAMIMAIVADDTGIPLNELVFKSIKLVEKK